MVLGTPHLNNPGRDVHNTFQVDDVLAEKRQRELREVLDLLADFKPTKIAVEVPQLGDNDARYDPSLRKHSGYLARYDDYLTGEYESSANEIDQIAFPLSKASGHRRLYAVDVPYRYSEEASRRTAEALGQDKYIQLADDLSQFTGEEMGQVLETSSLRDVLLFINDPGFLLRLQETYVPLVGVGEGDDYPGADLLTDWYARNVRIFRNVMHISEPGDRIVVMFGVGHAYYLRQLVKESPNHELVEVEEVLGG